MRNRRFWHAFTKVVRKLIAIVGLLVLASQVALGSVGALFLCLCAEELATHDASPCAPAGETATCLHDAAPAEPDAKADAPCDDVLIEGADIDSLDRLSDSSKVKAKSLLALIPFFLEPVAPLADQARDPLLAARPAAPAPAALACTRTVRLLI